MTLGKTGRTRKTQGRMMIIRPEDLVIATPLPVRTSGWLSRLMAAIVAPVSRLVRWATTVETVESVDWGGSWPPGMHGRQRYYDDLSMRDITHQQSAGYRVGDHRMTPWGS